MLMQHFQTGECVDLPEKEAMELDKRLWKQIVEPVPMPEIEVMTFEGIVSLPVNKLQGVRICDRGLVLGSFNN